MIQARKGLDMLNWIANRPVSEDANADPFDAAARRTPRASQKGLLAGTEVATPDGWRPVEAICAGDAVITFDGGVQAVRTVTRRLYPLGPMARCHPILHVSAGVIGNRSDLLLLPDQGVIVESDLAEAAWGDPFALVTATALDALEGVSTVLPDAPVVAVTLACEADEVLFCNGQALVHCPARAELAPETIEEAVWGAGASRYRLLNPEEAQLLTAELARDARDSGFAAA